MTFIQIEELIFNKIERHKHDYMFIAQVNSVNLTNGINIEANKIDGGQTVNITQIFGTGIGNAKGIFNFPAAGDFIMVMNYFGHYIMMGSVLDIYTDNRDGFIPINSDEMILVPKTNGSYIKFNSNDSIRIVSRNGSEITVNSNGTMEVKGDVTISGDLTVEGTTTFNGPVIGDNP